MKHGVKITGVAIIIIGASLYVYSTTLPKNALGVPVSTPLSYISGIILMAVGGLVLLFGIGRE